MILCSYSFSPNQIDVGFYYDVWKELEKLRWYFYKFAGSNADEAMERSLYHTLTHFNAEKGSLSAYVKKLAREITKENSRVIYLDFLEQTVSDEEDIDSPQVQSISTVHDFSDELVDAMELSENRYNDVVNLALEFMDKFLMLCEALKKRDVNTRYFPSVFIKSCMRISSRCTNFNQLCLDVYDKYGEKFKWFLDLDQDVGNWRESDFTMIRNSKSKRACLIDPKTDEEVEDADVDRFVLHGKLGDGAARKKIIKVSYYDVWSLMCDLLDAQETNVMKFIIGNSYVVRTFAGSLSVLNTDLFNMYDLVRSEILTNVLVDTCGRILNVGSENFYLLCNSDMNKEKLSCHVCGYDLELPYTDITDRIS